jgi:hypothetical protein
MTLDASVNLDSMELETFALVCVHILHGIINKLIYQIINFQTCVMVSVTMKENAVKIKRDNHSVLVPEALLENVVWKSLTLLILLVALPPSYLSSFSCSFLSG